MPGDALVLLRQAPLFRDLGDKLLEGLAAHLRRRTYRRGTIIFHKDQAGDALYIVESGRVRIFLPAEGGEELTIDDSGPGDVFGEMALLDGQARSASADASEDTVTFTLGREEFQKHLATSPELAAALIALLSTRLRRVMAYTETLAFLDVQGRLARALLDLAERHGARTEGGGVEVDLDLTQTELARMVGATRERVNRALASFRSQGVLELRGKRTVIRDPKRLKDRIY
jgi:CRP/FNR family transcriptional regulator/CRP/FNR family cyclic AMP-dependent transcriptional regulator